MTKINDIPCGGGAACHHLLSMIARGSPQLQHVLANGEKMELFWIVLLAGVVLVVAIFLLLLYSGLFYTYSIHCTVPASLPSRIAYSVHKGAYKKAGGAFWTLDSLVPHRRLFGIYYDDPNKVSVSQTRECLADLRVSKFTEVQFRKFLYY